MKVLDATALESLIAEAAASPRQRKNFNFHEGHADAIQRMFNAVEPDTFVRPHRHPQWELFVLIAGSCALLTFAEDGTVVERLDLADGGTRAVELSAGTWHSVVSCRTGTIIMEVKPGPYAPTGEADFGAWAPAEGTPEAAAYRDGMRTARPEPRRG